MKLVRAEKDAKQWKEKFEKLSAEFINMCYKINEFGDYIDDELKESFNATPHGINIVRNRFHELFGKIGLFKQQQNKED